ncbi:hypothetical protein [Micromonospora sp. WMMD737]|uniref:hypothetical protein n=1 Tax=Micromonospora sp. WMMD737 TaxID=3404113 RepID=UPI003B936A41
MTAIQAETFADAVLQRCAELLYAEMRPQIEKTAGARQRARKSAVAPRPVPRASGGSVVSLNAYRTRKSAAA